VSYDREMGAHDSRNHPQKVVRVNSGLMLVPSLGAARLG